MKIQRAALAAALLCSLALPVGAADERSVREELVKNTGLTAEAVRPSPLPGLWEVWIEDRLFYVDDRAEHVISGQIIETKTRVNLTEIAQKAKARENWKKWPLSDAVKQVFGKGERQLVVFSDANCTYCRMMEPVYAQVGNLTVYTFIVPMLRGEQNNREIVCSKNPSEAWHRWMGEGVAPAPAAAGCDSSVLQRNLALMNRFHISAAPTFFFKSGVRTTGAMPAAQLEELVSAVE